jgi:hypothetical protein
MYYRNANCAVVVYDITQTVSGTLLNAPSIDIITDLLHPVLTRESKGVDQRATTAGRLKYHHCTGR